MADTPLPVVEQTLAAYMKTENAREQREARGEIAPSPSVPDPTPSPDPSPAAEASSAPLPQVPAETDPKADERNPDGTFKPRNRREDPRAAVQSAIAKQREAERRAEAAEAKARELEAKTAPEPKPQPEPVAEAKKPVLDDFLNDPDPYASLAEALADYKVERALAARDAKDQASRAQSDFQRRVSDAHAIGADKYTDWADAMTSDFAASFTPPPHVVEAIFSSSHSADLLYYLSKNEPEARSEARDVAALSPLAAASKLGLLSTRAAAASSGPAPAVVLSRAKPPIQPVGASPSAPVRHEPDPDKVSLTEWNKFHNDRERRERLAVSGA